VVGGAGAAMLMGLGTKQSGGSEGPAKDDHGSPDKEV
jgi:hypothetical protein